MIKVDIWYMYVNKILSLLSVFLVILLLWFVLEKCLYIFQQENFVNVVIFDNNNYILKYKFVQFL